MNKFLTISLCLAATAAVAAKTPTPDLIARIHFVGVEQISANTNSTAFTNLFCSAEAQALREQTLEKLSHFPGTWFKNRIAADAGDEAKQFRPLLDDLLKSEWLWEIRDTTNAAPENVLAIRLNAARAQLWRENLAAVLQAWTRLTVAETANGWRLKKDMPPNLVRFVRVGDWVVLSWGQNELPLSDDVIQRIQAEKRPAPAKRNYWLAVDLDWPRLARWFSPLKIFDFPKLGMQVVGHSGNLRFDGKFTLTQPLPPLGKWQMPTNAIHQPLTGFTAVRGIGPWLARQSWARPYEIQPPPDQFFTWSILSIPFQTFAATPVSNTNAALTQLDAKLSRVFNGNPQVGFLAPMTTVLTNNAIAWRGVPYALPFVRALREPAGDFLFGGFFPNTPRSRPLPPELFQQLNTPNLVYYHWEITAERLKALPQLTQLMLLMTWHKQLNGNSAAGKWLNRIGPTLGNSVTEVVQTGPSELTFTRKAPGGLMAFEFIALANWLEATNFPGCDLRLPPRLVRPRRPLPQTTNAPAAPARLPPPPALPH
jgi:hypothetical protein